MLSVEILTHDRIQFNLKWKKKCEKKKKKKIDKNNILMHLLNKEFDLCLFARSRNIRQKLSKWLTLLVILMSCHVIINYVCTRNAWQQLRQKFVFSSSYARNVMWSLMMLLTFTPLWTNSTDDNLIIFLIFPPLPPPPLPPSPTPPPPPHTHTHIHTHIQKIGFVILKKYLQRETIRMKYQSLFSRENISECRLLKFLPITLAYWALTSREPVKKRYTLFCFFLS